MKKVHLIPISLLFLASNSFADPICGPSPTVPDHISEASLKASANVIFKQLGQANADVTIKEETRDVLHRYPNADKIATKIFLQWTTCTIVMSSTQLTDDQKISRVQESYKITQVNSE
ncbi:hypothetical protein [Klebsiella variicola]|uniref:hypothetical protein n=1 Tax=Klebsiella variicola TaxID=244366 RepID=UPI0010F886C9|nr:hypothetical protein [Klebsiella variicola]HDZ9772054.1 hypothetical protein [Klebsiella variicola subsp. variicola]ELA0883969.1 hypothetical protein [Klebsiella variicola]ELA1952023.1 hypothetical protein [Klebsiella variicola]WKL59593.1 hypothetical protein QZN18_16245 [Klebsiella variicola]HCB9331651.1 hypothetical protein [Klebsiella variicola]